MYVVVGLAVGLVLAGLAIAWLSSAAKIPILTTVCFWAGVVLAAIGLILLITPVLVWVSTQLHQMLGA